MMHSQVLDLPDRTGFVPVGRNLPATGVLASWNTALSMVVSFQQWVRRKTFPPSTKGGRVSAGGPNMRRLKECRGRSGEPAIERPFENGRWWRGTEAGSPAPGEPKAEHEDGTAEKVADLLPAFPLSSRPISWRLWQTKCAAGPGNVAVQA